MKAANNSLNAFLLSSWPLQLIYDRVLLPMTLVLVGLKSTFLLLLICLERETRSSGISLQALFAFMSSHDYLETGN
jgi:hypothetical protein